MIDPQVMIDEFATQLRGIASWADLTHVHRVELAIGDRYGVDAQQIARRLEELFENDPPDSKLEGAAVEARALAPGDRFPAPGRDENQTATGWEMLVIALK